VNPLTICNHAQSCPRNRQSDPYCFHERPHLPNAVNDCRIHPCLIHGDRTFCEPVKFVVIKEEQELK